VNRAAGALEHMCASMMRTLLALSALIALATGTVLADTSLKEVERRLHVTSVEASSFLWNDWNAFQENCHPELHRR
jgi:hypothetical protein